MPLLRYFVVVGGALLVLLLISDVVLPGQPLPGFLTTASSDLPPFRIHSDQKWPERIVFDTGGAMAKPAVVADVNPAAAPLTTTVAASDSVRDAFAQLPPAEKKAGSKTAASAGPTVSNVQEARLQSKRKVAKPRTSRPLVLVAQQPHSGRREPTW